MKVTPVVLLAATMLAGNTARACSCAWASPEEIASQDTYILTRLKILPPPRAEQRKVPGKPATRTFKVAVVENVKGKYEYDHIVVDTIYGDGSCGVKVDYRETVTVVGQKLADGTWSRHLGLCNRRSEQVAREVRALLGKPQPAPDRARD